MYLFHLSKRDRRKLDEQKQREVYFVIDFQENWQCSRGVLDAATGCVSVRKAGTSFFIAILVAIQGC
jgi:hypothetical protein